MNILLITRAGDHYVTFICCLYTFLWSEIPISILGLLFSFSLLVFNLLTLTFKISFYVKATKRAFVHLVSSIFFQFYDSLFIL